MTEFVISECFLSIFAVSFSRTNLFIFLEFLPHLPEHSLKRADCSTGVQNGVAYIPTPENNCFIDLVQFCRCLLWKVKSGPCLLYHGWKQNSSVICRAEFTKKKAMQKKTSRNLYKSTLWVFPNSKMCMHREKLHAVGEKKWPGNYKLNGSKNSRKPWSSNSSKLQSSLIIY